MTELEFAEVPNLNHSLRDSDRNKTFSPRLPWKRLKIGDHATQILECPWNITRMVSLENLRAWPFLFYFLTRMVNGTMEIYLCQGNGRSSRENSHIVFHCKKCFVSTCAKRNPPSTVQPGPQRLLVAAVIRTRPAGRPC
jgi:hypothetical protein